MGELQEKDPIERCDETYQLTNSLILRKRTEKKADYAVLLIFPSAWKKCVYATRHCLIVKDLRPMQGAE